MKLTTFVPALLTVVATTTAFAQDDSAANAAAAGAAPTDQPAAAVSAASDSTAFSDADADKDGLLSISEAQKVLPDLGLADANADGFVNQSEVEAALDGLTFSEHGHTGGSALVSEGEYDLIVSTIESDESESTSQQ